MANSQDFFLNDLKEQVDNKNLGSILRNVFERVVSVDIKKFYDFLGELLLENTQVLGSKEEIIRSYLKILKRAKIDSDRLSELEKYLVEKYFILDNEKLVLFFQGKLRSKHQRTYYKGRIFITNQRIMVIGEEVEDKSLGDAIMESF